MGTRAIIAVKENENEKDYCTFYRQFDGYPEGLGLELLEYIKDKPVVMDLIHLINFTKPLTELGTFALV